MLRGFLKDAHVRLAHPDSNHGATILRRGYSFTDYHPGYRTGWEGRARYEGRTFDEVESELRADYARNRGQSRLEWEKNRHAARAAWRRFDRDGDALERSQ